MKVTILGCGTSSGVPVVGLGWGACDPQEPRNRRRRASILVEEGGSALIVDTSPDLREQLIDADVRRLDAVLYSHVHADHCHGIDDLRWICQAMRTPLPAYGRSDHLAELKTRFAYAFTPVDGDYFYKPVLDARPIDVDPFQAGAIPVTPFIQDHGFSQTLGFRFGPIAYSTDVVDLDDAAFAALDGVEVWIVDCLQIDPHPTHANLDKVLTWVDRVQPRQTYLTHMNRDLDYQSLCRRLPDHIRPAHDGLTVEV